MISGPHEVDQLPNLFLNSLKSLIEKVAKEEFEKSLKEATERIRERQAEIVAGFALKMSTRMSVRSMDRTVVIEVKLEEPKP